MFDLSCPLGIIFWYDSNLFGTCIPVASQNDLWWNFVSSREYLGNYFAL
jgi:hypothetical protein